MVFVEGSNGNGIFCVVGGLVFEGVYQVDEQGLVYGGVVEYRGGVFGGYGVDGFVVVFFGVCVVEGCVDVFYFVSYVCLMKNKFKIGRAHV